MNKLLLSIILAFVYNAASAQIATAKSFKGHQWATANGDSSFFKADTVAIIRLKDDVGSVVNEDLADFYKSDYLLLSFESNKSFKLTSVAIDNWLMGTAESKNSWEFSKTDQKLILTRNNKTLAKFLVVSSSNIAVKSRVSDQAPILVNELKLVRTF